MIVIERQVCSLDVCHEVIMSETWILVLSKRDLIRDLYSIHCYGYLIFLGFQVAVVAIDSCGK